MAYKHNNYDQIPFGMTATVGRPDAHSDDINLHAGFVEDLTKTCMHGTCQLFN